MTTLFLLLFGVAVTVVGKAMVFKKMGVEKWKALIPVYSEYILFKKVWTVKAFKTSLLFVLGILASFVLAQALGSRLLVLLGLPCLVAEFCMTCQFLYKLSKSFGHGMGYAAGLVFAQPVFLNILGFEKSAYQVA